MKPILAILGICATVACQPIPVTTESQGATLPQITQEVNIVLCDDKDCLRRIEESIDATTADDDDDGGLW